MQITMDALDFIALAGAAGCSGLVIARIFLLQRSGVRVNTLGQKKSGLHRFVELLLLPMALVALLEIALHATHAAWHVFQPQGYGLWFDWPMLRWAGGACLLAAWWIMFLALQDMGLSYRLGVDEQNPGRLVTKGIFAYSRNPVYLGIEIFFLGQFLLFPNGFFFWMILGTMVFLHYMIIKEEQRLLAFHHAAYASYHGRVPRYFGFKRRNR